MVAMEPLGIPNYGNSCFLNSVLQVLLNINGLNNVLSHVPAVQGHSPLTQCLLALTRRMEGRGVAVQQLLYSLATTYKLAWRPGLQCDAEECLTALLEGLERELGTDVCSKLFGGKRRQERVCPCCRGVTEGRPEVFRVLSLPMTHDCYTLEDLLQSPKYRN